MPRKQARGQAKQASASTNSRNHHERDHERPDDRNHHPAAGRRRAAARAAANPLLLPSLLRNKGFTSGMLLGLVFFAAVGGLSYVISLFLQTALHFTPGGAALAMAPMMIGIIIASFLGRPLIPRLGRILVAIGLAVTLAGAAGLWTTVLNEGVHTSPWLWLLRCWYSAWAWACASPACSTWRSATSPGRGPARERLAERRPAAGRRDQLRRRHHGVLQRDGVPRRGHAMTVSVAVVAGIAALGLGLVWPACRVSAGRARVVVMSHLERFNAIGTDRLILRRWKDEDRAPFAELNGDPETLVFFPSTLSRDESDDYVDRIEARFPGSTASGCGLWRSGRPGSSSASQAWRRCARRAQRRRHGDRLAAGQAAWRILGYATEAARAARDVAFHGAALPEPWSMTAVLSTPSQAVMRRIGMTESVRFEHPGVPAGSPLRAT